MWGLGGIWSHQAYHLKCRSVYLPFSSFRGYLLSNVKLNISIGNWKSRCEKHYRPFSTEVLYFTILLLSKGILLNFLWNPFSEVKISWLSPWGRGKWGWGQGVKFRNFFQKLCIGGSQKSCSLALPSLAEEVRAGLAFPPAVTADLGHGSTKEPDTASRMWLAWCSAFLESGLQSPPWLAFNSFWHFIF